MSIPLCSLCSALVPTGVVLIAQQEGVEPVCWVCRVLERLRASLAMRRSYGRKAPAPPPEEAPDVLLPFQSKSRKERGPAWDAPRIHDVVEAWIVAHDGKIPVTRDFWREPDLPAPSVIRRHIGTMREFYAVFAGGKYTKAYGAIAAADRLEANQRGARAASAIRAAKRQAAQEVA